MSSFFWTEGPDALRQAFRENKAELLEWVDELIEQAKDEPSRVKYQRLREELVLNGERAIEGIISQSLF